jgi:hypothetical protein
MVCVAHRGLTLYYTDLQTTLYDLRIEEWQAEWRWALTLADAAFFFCLFFFFFWWYHGLLARCSTT